MLMPVGKYKGIEVAEVFTKDKNYLDWYLSTLKEKFDDPQWGNKNKERYEAISNIIANLSGVAEENPFKAAQVAKEKKEVGTDKFSVLEDKIDEIYNQLAVILWYVQGQPAKEVKPVEKPKEPVDIVWDE